MTRMNVPPMFCSCPAIWYCIPCTSETTAMTAATPIITPRTVRTDRILLAPMARRAILTFSKNIGRSSLRDDLAVAKVNDALRFLGHVVLVRDHDDGIAAR